MWYIKQNETNITIVKASSSISKIILRTPDTFNFYRAFRGSYASCINYCHSIAIGLKRTLSKHIFTSIKSLVVPGISLTIETYFLTSLFIRVLFPAFGLPAIEILMPSRAFCSLCEDYNTHSRWPIKTKAFYLAECINPIPTFLYSNFYLRLFELYIALNEALNTD